MEQFTKEEWRTRFTPYCHDLIGMDEDGSREGAERLATFTATQTGERTAAVPYRCAVKGWCWAAVSIAPGAPA